MKSLHAHAHSHHGSRGFTIVDLTATLAASVVFAAVALPLANAKDDISLRVISRMNLAELNEVHSTYAADHEDGQFSVIPDNYGQYNNPTAYPAANGCIDPLILGTGPQGTVWGYYIGCAATGSPGSSGNMTTYKPINMYSGSEGAYRLANCAKLNAYANGRFYDPLFYAAEDNSVTAEMRKFIRNGTDFAMTSNNRFALSSYTMSPAAMFHPAIMGDGDPKDDAHMGSASGGDVGGMGFQSPSVSQCLYPSLKTRLMEHSMMENAPAPCNPAYAGCVPYVWNQSIASTNLALFYDGSVDVFSAQEAMDADAMSGSGLWMRNTILGSAGLGGMWSADSIVRTSAHFLTKFGIRGRDRLEG